MEDNFKPEHDFPFISGRNIVTVEDFAYKDDRRKNELVRIIQKTLINLGFE